MKPMNPWVKLVRILINMAFITVGAALLWRGNDHAAIWCLVGAAVWPLPEGR